jgi:hypothetical protein
VQDCGDAGQDCFFPLQDDFGGHGRRRKNQAGYQAKVLCGRKPSSMPSAGKLMDEAGRREFSPAPLPQGRSMILDIKAETDFGKMTQRTILA